MARREERKEWEKGDERGVEGEEQWFVDAHTHIYKENFPDKPWIPERFPSTQNFQSHSQTITDGMDLVVAGNEAKLYSSCDSGCQVFELAA